MLATVALAQDEKERTVDKKKLYDSAVKHLKEVGLLPESNNPVKDAAEYCAIVTDTAGSSTFVRGIAKKAEAHYSYELDAKKGEANLKIHFSQISEILLADETISVGRDSA